MYISAYAKDLLNDALTVVRRRFPGYRISSGTERLIMVDPQQLLTGLVWHGPPTEVLQWQFSLEKQSDDSIGADQLEISICPLSEVLFHDSDEPETVEVGFRNFPKQPTYIELPFGMRIFDLYVSYDTEWKV